VRAVFGNSGIGSTIYYLVILSVILILYTGGNTSFNGFPFLANYVASDRYLPRQLTKRGHRLAFSNGILVLGVVSLSLIIIFKAQVNSLIALYAIGVFTGFTMAGAGMVARHLRERTGKWRWGVVVNGTSATVTALVVLIFVVAKIHRGCLDHRDRGTAYVYGVNPLNKQYEREVQAFEASATEEKMNIRTNRVVVFVDYYDLATERALQYCNTLNATPPGRFISISTRSSRSAWRIAGAHRAPRLRASVSKSLSVRTDASIARRSNSSRTSCATRTCSAW